MSAPPHDQRAQDAAISDREAQAIADAAGAEVPPGVRATSPKERQRGFRILFFCLLCLGMGQSLFFAVLPPIARDLGMTEIEVGAIFSLSALLWVFTSPFWGRRSDNVGRKPIMMLGLMGFGVSTLGFATVVYLGMEGIVSLALMFPLLIAVRSIFGTFGSGTMPASQAYVADRTTRMERASGVATIAAAFGMGTIIGPGFAAALVAIGLLVPFYAVGALAILSALAIWIFLPERTKPQKRKDGDPQLKLTDKRVVPFIVIGLLLSLAQSIQMQIVAFYFIDKLDLSTDEAAQLVGVGLMAMAMATLFAQLVLIQRFDLSVQQLMRWGAGIASLSFVMLVLGNDYGVLVFALVAAGLGFGMLRPGLSAGASLSVSPAEQGAMAGIIGSTAATGHIINPIVGMPLYRYMNEGPFILGALLMVAILIFVVLHPRIRAISEAYEEEDERFDIH